MVAMPAAHKLSPTLHIPVIINSGSPDTKVCYLPAARLDDVGTPCPLPPCKPPKPKIVSSSTTVFINKLGAARVLDFVYCGAMGTTGPGGCSHPSATGYKARKADHYEALFAVEHEQSDWDVEDEFKRGEYDGTREEAAAPVGVTAGSASAQSPEADTSGSPMGGTSPSPHGGATGGDATAVPNGGGAAIGGGGAPGKDSLAFDEEEARANKPLKLDLTFPLDLKIGKASGTKGIKPSVNKIAFGCLTVIIG